MNRSKYQLLKKHFKVSGESHMTPGRHLNVSRLCLADSMLEFLCKGQSFDNNANKNSNKVAKSTLPIPGGHTAARMYSYINRANKLINMEDNKRTIGARCSINGQPVGDPGMTNVLTPWGVKDSLMGVKDSVVDDGMLTLYDPVHQHIGDIAEMDQTCLHPQVNTTYPSPYTPANSEEHNPSFTLKPSVSGNNIKFSCTIDKRLLRDLDTPLNLEFKQPHLLNSKTDFPNNPDGITHAQYTHEDGLSIKQSGPENDKSSRLEGHVNDLARKVKSLTHSSVYQRGVSDTVLNTLTFENLQGLGSCANSDPDMRKRVIETWVEDVNKACHILPPPPADSHFITVKLRTIHTDKYATVNSGHLHAMNKKKIDEEAPPVGGNVQNIPDCTPLHYPELQITPFGVIQCKVTQCHKSAEQPANKYQAKAVNRDNKDEKIITAIYRGTNVNKAFNSDIEQSKITNENLVSQMEKTLGAKNNKPKHPVVEKLIGCENKAMKMPLNSSIGKMVGSEKKEPHITSTSSLPSAMEKKAGGCQKPKQKGVVLIKGRTNRKNNLERGSAVNSFKEKFMIRPMTSDMLQTKPAFPKTETPQSGFREHSQGFKSKQKLIKYRNQFLLNSHKLGEHIQSSNYRYPLLRKPIHGQTNPTSSSPCRSTIVATGATK